MEKEVEAVLRLFREGLSDANESRSIGLIFEAIRRISSALPFAESDPLTSHPELLKMLIVCSPLNEETVHLLLETIFDKFKVLLQQLQDREYVIFGVWKLCEAIAELDLRNAAVILNRSIIDFGEQSLRKSAAPTKVEETYMTKHLWDIKKMVLQLLPQLFTIVEKHSPTEIKEKLSIFRVLKSDCRNPQLALQISRTAEALKAKYGLQPQARKSKIDPSRMEKRRTTVRKLPPQDNFGEDKPFIEQYTRNKCEDLLGLLKSDANVEAFLSYIVKPDAQLPDEKVWLGIPIEEARSLRASCALEMMRDLRFFRRFVAAYPELFNVFFGYLESKSPGELCLPGVKQLLELFMRDDAIVVTTLMMRSDLLENFFPELQDKLVYEFMLKVIGLFNVRQQSALNLKKVYYNYLEQKGFFHQLIRNVQSIDHSVFTSLKNSHLQELDFAVKRYYTDRRKLKTLLLNSSVVQSVNEMTYVPNKTTFFQTLSTKQVYQSEMPVKADNVKPAKTVASKKTLASSKKSIPEEPREYKPPYAVSEYRGYYSTAPILNFFCMEMESVDLSHEDWHGAASSFYLEVLQSIVECPFNVPLEIVRAVLPDSTELVEELFLALNRYTALLPQHQDNSSKTIVKILNILLGSELFMENNTMLAGLCLKYLNKLYPIICKLFKQPKEPVECQPTKIVKVLGEDALDVVELLVNFLKKIRPSDLIPALNNAPKDLWLILMLWFFDCCLNNLYQALFYDIFEILFKHGSQSLLVQVLFKFNLTSCLHNAYSDVVRERVLVVDWHMHSFYLYLRRLHALIESTLQARPELAALRSNLNKTVAWHLLTEKLRLGLYTVTGAREPATQVSHLTQRELSQCATNRTLLAPP